MPSSFLRSLTALLAVTFTLALPAAAQEADSTVASPPGPVTNLTATPGNGQVSLSWTAAEPGRISSPITDHQINVTEVGSGRNVRGYNTGTGATSEMITGLTNGTAYNFRVFARNAAGRYSTSASNVRATPVGPTTGQPGAPTGLTAAAGDGQVSLSWTAPSDDGGSAITGYRIQHYTVGGSMTYVVQSGTATTATVTGLSNGTEYEFRVAAKNTVGFGTASGNASATPNGSVAVPAAPTGLTADAWGGWVLLGWSAPSGPVTGYEYSQDDGAWKAVTGSGTSHQVNGLTQGSTYSFKVRAKNSAGAGAASAALSVTTVVQPTHAPTGLTATPGNGKITLSWTAPAAGGDPIDRYDYSRDGGYGAIAIWDSTATTYVVTTGLSNGSSYQFRVRAVNKGGISPWSNIATATFHTTLPRPAAPTGLTATAGNGQATLAWTNPSGPIASHQYSQNGTWNDMSGSGAQTSKVIHHLTNGTEYTFKVRAVNNAGAGAGSNAVKVTPKAPVTAPAAPTGLTATAGDKQATLAWTKPSGPISGYDYSQDNGANWSAMSGGSSATTSYVVSSLANGTQYTFKVRAKNSAGNGAASSAASATPAAAVTAPAAPTGLTAEPGATQATLAWTAPSGPISGYEVSQDNGSAWTAISGSSSSTTSHVVSGLTSGTQYTFKVRAKNSAGSGAASSGASATVPPAAPSGLSAAAGNKQATLSWTAPSGIVTGYDYSQDDGSTWKTISGSGASTTSHVADGLTNGTEYTFQVRAKNSGGSGAASSAATATPAAPVTAPAAPTSLTATAGDTQATLAWTAPSGPISGYAYSQDNGSTWKAVSDSDGSTTSHVASGLTNGTEYTFKVRAKNSAGDGAASSAAKATPAEPVTAPAAPTGLTAEGGDTQATLSWTKPSGPISGYAYSQDNGSTWKAVADSDASTTSHVASGLTNGTEYTFQVRAKNSAGDGAASSAAKATPKAPVVAPGAPTGLTAEGSNTQATLAWTAPSGPISGYDYSQDNGATWKAVTGSDASTTAHVASGLTNDTQYAFKVRAKNSAGAGAASSAARATPQAPSQPPPGPPPTPEGGSDEAEDDEEEKAEPVPALPLAALGLLAALLSAAGARSVRRRRRG